MEERNEIKKDEEKKVKYIIIVSSTRQDSTMNDPNAAVKGTFQVEKYLMTMPNIESDTETRKKYIKRDYCNNDTDVDVKVEELYMSEKDFNDKYGKYTVDAIKGAILQQHRSGARPTITPDTYCTTKEIIESFREENNIAKENYKAANKEKLYIQGRSIRDVAKDKDLFSSRKEEPKEQTPTKGFEKK